LFFEAKFSAFLWGGRARTTPAPKVLALKCCSGEAQHSAVQEVFIRGTGAKADELFPKKLFFLVVTCRLRTLWLAAARTRPQATSKAEPALH
jgi:hypothetical protein